MRSRTSDSLARANSQPSVFRVRCWSFFCRRGFVSTQVNSHEAKTHFSRLVERAAAGEEIVIAKAGEPRARLVPLVDAAPRRRKPGSMKGKIWLAPDWDSPEVNTEIANLFEGADDFFDLETGKSRRPD